MTPKFAITAALVAFIRTSAAQAEDDQAALLKALPGAKISLQQGITQVAKGNEVATEAKYEMDKGKLALTVYTSSKGFDTPAEDNAFNEYGGDATAAAWKPEKEVFADLKHIAPDLILHGGDLVFGGTRPAEIIDEIRSLGWPGVLGNTARCSGRRSG